MRKDRENRIYCSIVNYDEFQGISVPKDMEKLIDFVNENTTEFFDLITDDYDEYRDWEVEVASQARDGSSGTEDLNTPQKFKERFPRIFVDEKIKKYFDENYTDVIEEKIITPTQSHGITGWTY